MKLCMIGKRGHAFYVFQSIREVPGIELPCVSSGCGDDPEPLLKMARDNGFLPEFRADWKAMLDEFRPDVLCIDGPFELHAEMCAEALKRNINVFCEKPIALTLEQLEIIRAAYEKSSARIVSMVGLRYEPAFYQAHKMVSAGAVGKVKTVRAQKSYRLGTRPEFYKHRATYGGTIPWVGSHALDWILWFSGSDFESVSAIQTTEDNFGNGDLEIAAHCQFRMKSGVLASAGIDYLRPAAAPTHGDDRVRVAGTEGVIEVRGGKIHYIGKDGEQVITPETPDRRLFSDFLLELAGGRPGLVSDDETFKLTHACLLAQKAADTGTTIFF